MKTTAEYEPNFSPILVDLHDQLKKIDASIQNLEGKRARVLGAIASLDEKEPAPQSQPAKPAGKKTPAKKAEAPAKAKKEEATKPKAAKPKAAKKTAAPKAESPAAPKSSGKTVPPIPVSTAPAPEKAKGSTKPPFTLAQDDEVSDPGALMDKALEKCGDTFTNHDIRDRMKAINPTVTEKLGKNYISNRLAWLADKKVVIQTNPEVGPKKLKLWKRG